MRLTLHRTRESLCSARSTSRVISPILLPRSLHHRAIRESYRGSTSSFIAADRLPLRGQKLRLGRSTTTSTPAPLTAIYSRLGARQKNQGEKFYSTSSAMTATKIDGTAIAKSIRERLHAEIENTQKTNPRYKPSLKIIQGKLSLYSVRSLELTCHSQSVTDQIQVCQVESLRASGRY